ncbi:MAG: hypothetical protein HYY18_00570 [Planctomycetes bacterium]|nr:hypothetical protein [Planctomycetota bacterium]
MRRAAIYHVAVDGKVLPGRSRASRETPIALVIGPLVVLIGLIALAGALRGVRPRQEHELPQHPAVLVGTALLASAVGVWIFAEGLRASREAPRRWSVLSRVPPTAWHADYSWDATGTRDETLRDAIGPLGVGIAMALLMAPYTEVAFFFPDSNWKKRAIMTAGNLVAVGFLAYGLYLGARRVRFGQSSLAFASFPFFLGGPLDVVFRTSASAREFHMLEVTLRCIEERREDTFGRNEFVRREIWMAGQTVPRPSDPMRLLFELPGDPALATRLSAPEPRYWELDVAGRRPGLDFHATFLVPVYAPLSEAAARRAPGPQ